MTLDPDKLLQAARSATDDGGAAERRVRARLASEEAAIDQLLAAVPGPRLGAEARVRARLQSREPARSLPWLVPAGLLFAVSAMAAVAWVGATPVEAVLERMVLVPSEARLEIGEHAVFEVDGHGTLSGLLSAPRVTWDAGTLRAIVDPGHGVELVIETPEAVVRVIGTRFGVTRDPLGTRVGVERGVVRVECVDGARHELEDGGDITCVPVRPGALLGRARQLMRGGADVELVVAAVAGGLETAEGATRGELLALMVTVLAESDPRRALEAARRYVAEGHRQRPEMAARITQLTLQLCEGGVCEEGTTP